MSESQNVTLSTLVATVAENAGLSKTLVNSISRALLDAVVAQVVAGETVRISGLGTFEAVDTAARQGVNPATQEAITIAASKRVSFKAAKGFKDAVKATVA